VARDGKHSARAGDTEIEELAIQSELLRRALVEFVLLMSRPGGFPKSRLYSRLNCEKLS